MKKIRKKYIIAALSLVGVLVIAVTMAYFSDTDTVTNSFTVGDVEMKIIEPNYPVDPNERILAQGQQMPKDPTVVNTGKNDELVFLRVSMPLEKVTLLDTDGQKIDDGTAKLSEIFECLTDSENKTTDGNITHNKDWILLDEPETRSQTKIYLFGYSKKVKAGDESEPLFDKVKLVNFIEQSSITTSAEKIDIFAYAIQSNDIEGVESESDGTYSKASLKAAYDTVLKLKNSENKAGGNG